jgi:hypothetical protein
VEGEGVGVGGRGNGGGGNILSLRGGGGEGSSFLWAARMTIVMVGNKYAEIVIPPSFLNPFTYKKGGKSRNIQKKGAKRHTLKYERITLTNTRKIFLKNMYFVLDY